MQEQHYRDQYRRMLQMLVFLGVMAVGLTAVLGYMVLRPPQPAYYATTTSGDVIPMHSLSEPVVTNQFLLQWASVATREALNLDFVHYQTQLQSAKPYFTSEGWSSMKAALTSSGLLKTVLSQKLEMDAVVSGPAVILNRYISHGRFTWRLQLPLLVTFQSASTQFKARWVATMTVQRVAALEDHNGIQITNFEATPNEG